MEDDPGRQFRSSLNWPYSSKAFAFLLRLHATGRRGLQAAQPLLPKAHSVHASNFYFFLSLLDGQAIHYVRRLTFELGHHQCLRVLPYLQARFPSLRTLSLHLRVCDVPDLDTLPGRSSVFPALSFVASLDNLTEFALTLTSDAELDVGGLESVILCSSISTLALHVEAPSFRAAFVPSPSSDPPVLDVELSRTSLSIAGELNYFTNRRVRKARIIAVDDIFWHDASQAWREGSSGHGNFAFDFGTFLHSHADSLTYLSLVEVRIEFAHLDVIATLQRLTRLDWHPHNATLWKDVPDFASYQPAIVDDPVRKVPWQFADPAISAHLVLPPEQDAQVRYLVATLLPRLPELIIFHAGTDTEQVDSPAWLRDVQGESFWRFVWEHPHPSLHLVGLGICLPDRRAHRHVGVCATCQSTIGFASWSRSPAHRAWQESRVSCLVDACERCESSSFDTSALHARKVSAAATN